MAELGDGPEQPLEREPVARARALATRHESSVAPCGRRRTTRAQGA